MMASRLVAQRFAAHARRGAAIAARGAARTQGSSAFLLAAPAVVALGIGGTALCLSIEEWSARDLEDVSVEAAFLADPTWTRADTRTDRRGNPIYDALGAKTDGLRAYKIYAKTDGSEVAAIATFGTVIGHPGVVHGGVTSLLFDNTLGWANAFAVLAQEGALAPDVDPMQAAALRKKSTAVFGFTANLHVNYRKPILVGTTVVINCKIDRVEGRKRFLAGAMTDAKTGAVLADATALFIIPRAA